MFADVLRVSHHRSFALVETSLQVLAIRHALQMELVSFFLVHFLFRLFCLFRLEILVKNFVVPGEGDHKISFRLISISMPIALLNFLLDDATSFVLSQEISKGEYRQ